MGLLLESMGKYWKLAPTHLQAGSPSPVEGGEGGGGPVCQFHTHHTFTSVGERLQGWIVLANSG